MTTRRATLRYAAAATGAVAAAPLLNAAPHPPDAASDPFDALRSRWVAMLTGIDVAPLDRPPYRAIVTGIADTARVWLRTMARPDGDTADLWNDASAGHGEFNTRISADRLRVIALAWATPGTELSGSREIERILLSALTWFERRRYNTTIAQTGNWWEWEIGIPLALTDLLFLLHAPLSRSDAALLRRLSAAIGRFAADATKGTGANRVWRAHIVLLNAVLARDAARIVAARDVIPPTFAVVARGDGFHWDGSFIQHHDLAYTGGYGYELLIRAALLIYLLDDGPWPFARTDVLVLRNWVIRAFAPLMYRGAMMDMSRGRNISRAYVTDVTTGQTVIVAVLYIAAVLRDATLTGLAKGWIAGARGHSDVFAYDPRLPAYWMTPHMAWIIASAIADRRAPPAPDAVATIAYRDMARFVHRRPGFSLAVAMGSRRIRNFETINDENLHGWYTGWGMTTLYRPDRPSYADDFWPTVDPYRLPGVTLDMRPRPPGKPSGANASDQVGALAFDGVGMAAMENRTDDGGFRARVGWYAAGDVVVCVGSGIRSDTEHAVETVLVNHRPGKTAGPALIVDGRAVDTAPGERRTLRDVRWAHVAGHGGLILPGATSLELLHSRRTGAWSDINRQGFSPRDPRTQTYLTLWVDHGSRPPNAAYTYALLPGADAAKTRAFARSGAVHVLTNSDALHHVTIACEEYLVAALNFWTAGRSDDGRVVASAPLLVMTKRRGRDLRIAIADPLPAESGGIALTLAMPGATIVKHDPALRVRTDAAGLSVDLDRAGLRGRTVLLRVRLL